jgi:hypothetical protein
MEQGTGEATDVLVCSVQCAARYNYHQLVTPQFSDVTHGYGAAKITAEVRPSAVQDE